MDVSIPGQFDVAVLPKSVSTNFGAGPDPVQDITWRVSPFLAPELY